MTVNEIIKMIRKAGCRKIREGRNHEIWLNPATGVTFPVPRHGGKELPTGNANKILNDAGIK